MFPKASKHYEILFFIMTIVGICKRTGIVIRFGAGWYRAITYIMIYGRIKIRFYLWCDTGHTRIRARRAIIRERPYHTILKTTIPTKCPTGTAFVFKGIVASIKANNIKNFATFGCCRYFYSGPIRINQRLVQQRRIFIKICNISDSHVIKRHSVFFPGIVQSISPRRHRGRANRTKNQQGK